MKKCKTKTNRPLAMKTTMNMVLPVRPVSAGRNCYVTITSKSCIKKKYLSIWMLMNHLNIIKSLNLVIPIHT